MNRQPCVMTTIIILCGVCTAALSNARRAEAAEAEPAARISIDDGHPWLPPFGLQRVGQPPDAVVEIRSPSEPTTEYCLVAYEQGKEIGRSALTLSGKTPETCRVALDPRATEVVLTAKPSGGAAVELARQSVSRPAFQADALVQLEHPVHPVDLGAILVPSDWLLLADGQTGTVAVAAFCRA
ncbi:MAG: hypothetical protein NTW96_01570, partial [Planctomycetia bacterium]|nr:hypothetical protein [Planctomycetia bacterium]